MLDRRHPPASGHQDSCCSVIAARSWSPRVRRRLVPWACGPAPDLRCRIGRVNTPSADEQIASLTAALKATRDLASRTATALDRAPRPEVGGWLPADEVAEVRLVGLWIAANNPPAMEIAPHVDAERVARFAARVRRDWSASRRTP